MPYWAIVTPHELLIKTQGFAEQALAHPRDFCCFVQSNGNPRRTRRRLEFFQALFYSMDILFSASTFLGALESHKPSCILSNGNRTVALTISFHSNI